MTFTELFNYLTKMECFTRKQAVLGIRFACGLESPSTLCEAAHHFKWGVQRLVSDADIAAILEVNDIISRME